jgi:eukaryotic-like serine/threonine-protein kinase
VYSAGDSIGAYSVIAKLGEGGFGAVYHVADPSGAEFAVKVCHHDDELTRRRFAREVRIMESMRHPNVMPVLASELAHEPPFFVMPLALRSLSDEIASLRGDVSACLAAFKDIARGVDAIHAANATHRDIKPLNALRLVDGTVAVSDLGLAKFNHRDTTVLTTTTAHLGTVVYAAPEQFEDGGSAAADVRTDVYQIGKTLYHLLTGELPHSMNLKRLDPALAHIVQRATRHDPQDRYQSVDELLAAVASYEQSVDPDAHPATAFDRARVSLINADGSWNDAALHRLIAIVASHQGDSSLVVERFEALSRDVLSRMSREKPGEAETLVGFYRDAIVSSIGGYGFGHAETVATLMSAVFEAGSPTWKASALEATLVAAVALNRWAAMDVFDALLMRVQSTADAVAVAEMLRQRLYEYGRVAERVSEGKLHAAIRAVRQLVLPESH